MNNYLIPANSKRSMLIFGLFKPVDLIIAGTGATLTLILMFAISAKTVKDILLILLPLLIAGAMVMPVPNHRNLWTFTANVYNFFSNRRQYKWRGWCMNYGKEEK